MSLASFPPDLERENFFSHAIFRPAPQLTERLEEAHGIAR